MKVLSSAQELWLLKPHKTDFQTLQGHDLVPPCEEHVPY